ncbi:hypothetical protein BAUCODRAFT_28908, partial [Baudoinia panamericana UAMH 10762]
MNPLSHPVEESEPRIDAEMPLQSTTCSNLTMQRGLTSYSLELTSHPLDPGPAFQLHSQCMKRKAAASSTLRISGIEVPSCSSAFRGAFYM